VPGALQSQFPAAGADGARRVYLVFKDGYSPKAVMFVVHVPKNEWYKNGNSDFKVDLPRSWRAPPTVALAPEMTGGPPVAPRPQGPDFDTVVKQAMASAQGTTRILKWQTNGFTVALVASAGAGGTTVRALTDAEDSVMLHWGLAEEDKKWLSGTSQDFAPTADEGVKEVAISLAPDQAKPYFMFVLKLGENHWVKDGGRDFSFEMPQDEHIVEARRELVRQKTQELEVARKKLEAEASQFQSALAKFKEGRKGRKEAAKQSFLSIELSEGAGEIDVACIPVDGGFKVEVSACLDPKVSPAASTVLHWGTIQSAKRNKDWLCPREDLLPEGTKIVDNKACQSPLDILDSGAYGISFTMGGVQDEHGSGPEIVGMAFVVHCKEGNRWFKCKDGKDCCAVFREIQGSGTWKGARPDVVSKILEAETEWGHMTLMHRYNLCGGMASEWESSTGGRTLRRAPSWSQLFRTTSSRSWSRSFSLSLINSLDNEDVEHEDDEFWSWIFVWQRFSFMKLVDWQRNYNTKPRELAGATDGLANKICSIWKEHPNVRLWCRWTLATLGRGGNRGQDIRDEILHIMHRNKIPEVSGHFYEQWHQKLHNNTTPDDIGICKALLAFLRAGGNMDVYWRVLGEHGISKQRLASYDRRIDKEPYMHGDTGRMIMEFENYLKILQSVHDALDLQTSIEASRWCTPGDLQQKLDGIMSMGEVRGRSRSMGNLNEGALDGSHGRFMRVADARSSLLAILNDKRTDVGAIRQLLLLDYSLETQQTVLIQGMTGETRLPNLVDQLRALMTAIVGHMPLHDEIRSVLVDWIHFSPDCASLRYNNSAVESALLLKSMVDRLTRVVGEQVDMFQNLIGPKAQHIGHAVGTDKQVLDFFVDEILRGSALFSVSLVLKRLEPQLRGIAHLPPWQMISAVDRPVQGELKVIDRMVGMEHLIFETPTIFLSGMVSGEEEVPVGVQAVLVKDAASAPDILSHCAVRARNSGVLLATCFDPDITARIESELAGQWVKVICKPDGSLSVERAERPSTDRKIMRQLSRSNIDFAQDQMQGSGETKLLNMNLKDDMHCSWVVTPKEMDGRKVGSKSLNLAMLAPKLPAEVYTPQAVAMPYGCMQKALTHAENKVGLAKLETLLKKLQPTTKNDDARVIFEEAQRLSGGAT
jgi:alpha-glucan,water dikinase